MIQIIENPSRDVWNDLTLRHQPDDELVSARVASIIEQVRNEGDEALFRLAKEIDRVEDACLQVCRETINASAGKICPELKKSINIASGNIERFHKAQDSTGVDIETVPGVRCLQRSVPILRVGLYIPGGTAPLFSTVLMLALPAHIAGCKEIVLCTPPARNLSIEILYAASICGVSDVFTVGECERFSIQ